MKTKQIAFFLTLAGLVVLACSTIEEFVDARACGLSGGVWYPVEKYCKYPPKPIQTESVAGPATLPPAGPPSLPIAVGPTGPYLTSTPASAQSCDASIHIVAVADVVKEVKEIYYRDCIYELSIMNIHPRDQIWILWHQRTVVHSKATDMDDSYWYSELIDIGQTWEKEFKSSYSTDGQISQVGVDMVAAVYNRLDCLYLLSSNEVEAIGKEIEPLCQP